MHELELFHNPRCSKSRAALQLLRERGFEPTLRLYLDDPPGVDELRVLLSRLDCPVADIVRTAESVFKELGKVVEDLDEAAVLEFIAASPVFLQRPILVHGEHAVVGRPPERVLELLGLQDA